VNLGIELQVLKLFSFRVVFVLTDQILINTLERRSRFIRRLFLFEFFSGWNIKNITTELMKQYYKLKKDRNRLENCFIGDLNLLERLAMNESNFSCLESAMKSEEDYFHLVFERSSTLRTIFLSLAFIIMPANAILCYSVIW
jgi:hypothetical protein